MVVGTDVETRRLAVEADGVCSTPITGLREISEGGLCESELAPEGLEICVSQGVAVQLRIVVKVADLPAVVGECCLILAEYHPIQCSNV